MYSNIFCILLFAFICNSLKNQHNYFTNRRVTGEPLFLTPLIENGDFIKGQSLSKVKHCGFQNVESYAGYITVNKTYNSNMFFWYFPAESNSENAPVVLWLSGGPGVSSLYGLFIENGPFFITEHGVKKRKYTWSRNHNVIYIDNPVGTGFSFTENEEGYARNQLDVGRDLYNCLVQFFQLFPSLQKNDFYATGESYAGKYVPAVSYAIHQNNADAKVKINLKGLAVGNGACDPIHQLGYGDYLYQLGLIDNAALDDFHHYEENIAKQIENQNYVTAFELIDELILSSIKNLTGFKSFYNYLHTEEEADDEQFTKFVQKADIRKAIHIGEQAFYATNDKIMEDLKADNQKTVAPWISELLSHYRCLFYSGQLDMRLPYPGTVKFLRNLKFSADAEYKSAKRRIWKVNGEVAGYSKVAGNLTEVLVRNAGHMVPMDQPFLAWDLITRFTSGRPFH